LQKSYPVGNNGVSSIDTTEPLLLIGNVNVSFGKGRGGKRLMILLGKRTKEKTENSKKDNADQHQREEDTARSQRVALESNQSVHIIHPDLIIHIISYHIVSYTSEKVYLSNDKAGGNPSQSPSYTSILLRIPTQVISSIYGI
jgi:hypothetical protein